MCDKAEGIAFTDVLANRVSSFQNQITLDPTDEFDKILIELKALHDRKRADYSETGNRFSNFEEAAHDADITTDQVFRVMKGIKKARLNVLLKGKSLPKNEPIRDTLRDECVYDILRLAYYDKVNHAD